MPEKESVPESLVKSAFRSLLRVAFVFEPLAPTAVIVSTNRQLHRFKKHGPAGVSKTKTERLSKFHYRINVIGMYTIDLDSLFTSQKSRFRR